MKILVNRVKRVVYGKQSCQLKISILRSAEPSGIPKLERSASQIDLDTLSSALEGEKRTVTASIRMNVPNPTEAVVNWSGRSTPSSMSAFLPAKTRRLCGRRFSRRNRQSVRRISSKIPMYWNFSMWSRSLRYDPTDAGGTGILHLKRASQN